MNPETGLCVKCGGAMYDNRTKNIERVAQGLKQMPMYSCKDKSCGNVVWPPRDSKPQQVSQYNNQPSFAKQAVPVNNKPDWDAIAEGKVRHAFAVEAYKSGKTLDTKTVLEINEWVSYVMSGKLNKDLDV